MSDKVATVCTRLRDKGIVVSRDNEWLNACVECFVSNNVGHSAKQLFDFVYEQWTLADLKDVAAATLPSDCSDCIKMLLVGKFAVQLNYFLNLSTPFHKQMLRIRNPKAHVRLNCANETEAKAAASARALKMEITDGVTTLIGFEDSALTAIVNPIPGEKAILSGPVEVRRGVLMLSGDNIKLLGGEVDNFLVANAEENVLARLLKLPVNLDPYNIGGVGHDEGGQGGGVPDSQRNRVSDESEAVFSFPLPIYEPPESNSNSRVAVRPGSGQKRRVSTEESSSSRDTSGRPKMSRNESTLVTPEDDSRDWIPPNAKSNLEHVRPSHEHGKLLVDYTDLSTLLLDVDLVALEKSATQSKSSGPLEEPFPPNEFPATRKAFGRVVKAMNKLQLKDSKWQLSAVVETKGMQLEMDFSPEALDKIFTVSAQEILRQRDQLRWNPALKDELNANLRESQRKVLSLDCEMVIHFKNFISKPLVTDVIQN